MHIDVCSEWNVFLLYREKEKMKLYFYENWHRNKIFISHPHFLVANSPERFPSFQASYKRNNNIFSRNLKSQLR